MKEVRIKDRELKCQGVKVGLPGHCHLARSLPAGRMDSRARLENRFGIENCFGV